MTIDTPVAGMVIFQTNQMTITMVDLQEEGDQMIQ